MDLEATKKPQSVILLLLVCFASVGAVLFTPALPAIGAFFQVSVGKAQLTVTSFMIGYALGQLPYGPLANRFGRKKTLYIGIVLSIIGSLLCALSMPLNSFVLLVFARFVQALGACVGIKISFTMVADSYNQTDSTKMISRFMIAFAIMPGVAMAIGGWLTQLINWQSCFYFLALYGMFLLWLCTKLPETAKSQDKSALNLTSIMQGYSTAFKNKHLVLCSLLMGCATSVVYIYASKAPFIGIELMGMTPNVYGTYNLLPQIGMLIGSFLSAKLAGRYSIPSILFIGIIGSIAASLSLLIPFLAGIHTATSLFLPMFLIYSIQSIVFANASSFGLSKAENKSNGSAVLNFLNLAATTVSVILVEIIYPSSALLMPLSFTALFVLMVFIWRRLKKLNT